MLRIVGTLGCSARSPTYLPIRIFYGRSGGGAGRHRTCFSYAETDSNVRAVQYLKASENFTTAGSDSASVPAPTAAQ